MLVQHVSVHGMQEVEDGIFRVVERVPPANEAPLTEDLQTTTDGNGRVDIGRARDVGRGELRADRRGNLEHGPIFGPELIKRQSTTSSSRFGSDFSIIRGE